MIAADAPYAPPAARPEPSAAKAAAPERAEHKGKSFADVLNAETADAGSDTADFTTEDTTSTDATASMLPTQPAPPPVTPVTSSPAAILAGLNLNAAVTEGDVETPAIDGDAIPSIIPDISIDVPAASATPVAAAPVSPQDADTQAVTAEAAVAPAIPTPVKPSTRKDAAADQLGLTHDTAEASSTDDAVETAPAKAATVSEPAQPAVTAAAVLLVPVVAPDQKTETVSAPGAERAAEAIEPSSTTATKPATAKAAADGADANPQVTANKAAQAAATATVDAAPEIKTDATTAATSASPADALAATRTSGAETAKAAQTSPATQTAPAATIQVYSRMIERFDGRAQRFEIRLDPAELGRVDVRIEVGADKKVHAVLAAHDSAALSDLMRGQRSLENALKQAGIDVADGGIKFELASDNGRNLSNGASRGDTNGNGKTYGNNVWRGFSTADVPVDSSAAAAARPWRSSRLDVVA